MLGVDAHEDAVVPALLFLFVVVGRCGNGFEVTVFVFVFDIRIVGSSLSCPFVNKETVVTRERACAS